jgi:hypothetical protein
LYPKKTTQILSAQIIYFLFTFNAAQQQHYARLKEMKLANQLILGAILAVGLLSSIVSSAPFTKGNILVLKGDFVEDESCTRGYVNELTPSGEFVQEIALPTEETEASYPCLIAAGDYSSRLTVSNDGYRAIMACCNVVNETDSFLQSFAVIYGNGLIVRLCRTEREKPYIMLS